MRTKLEIDDDVLLAAKALATQRNLSLGAVISELARNALRQPRSGGERNGVPLLAVEPNAALVTLEMVNELRDELP